MASTDVKGRLNALITKRRAAQVDAVCRRGTSASGTYVVNPQFSVSGPLHSLSLGDGTDCSKALTVGVAREGRYSVRLISSSTYYQERKMTSNRLHGTDV